MVGFASVIYKNIDVGPTMVVVPNVTTVAVLGWVIVTTQQLNAVPVPTVYVVERPFPDPILDTRLEPVPDTVVVANADAVAPGYDAMMKYVPVLPCGKLTVFAPIAIVTGKDVFDTVKLDPKAWVLSMLAVAVPAKELRLELLRSVSTGLRNSISYVTHKSPRTTPLACWPDVANVVLPKSYINTVSPLGTAEVRMY